MNLKDYLKTNYMRAFCVLFLITLTQAGTTIYTYLTSPQLNAIAKGKFTLFIELLALQFIVGQVCNASYNFASVQNTKQTQHLFHQVRQNILHHYYQTPAKVSEIENHLGNDLQLIESNYYGLFFNFTCDLIYTILTIGTLFTFHWILVVYSLLVAFFAIIVPRFLEKYTNKATQEVSNKNAHFLNVIENWFNGLEELRRYKNKNILKKEIGESSSKLEKSEFQREKVLTYVALVSAIFEILGKVGVPAIAGILFFNHQVNLGAILTAGYFANGIFYCVRNCVSNYAQLKSTQTLRNRLSDLQKVKKEKHYDSIDDIDEIIATGLTVQYNCSKKISYPDLVIKRGEKILLTGDSGTGKSTLLKVLLGQIKPNSGEVVYKNKSGKSMHPNLKRLGYLEQELIMFNGSILDNITMFDSRLDDKAKIAVNPNAFSKDVKNLKNGLSTKINVKKNILSGGQRQKVVLMRALVHNKPILFLDEATSAIDRNATTKILRNLTQGKQTILMIAHNLNKEQKDLFDREIYLETK